ncbi:hypothetical protein [uncultured Mucilaginibacter sp.]|uniref:hypothetical protein n=1 Tax=uncultured Mucilaginibacter sp. TaxID=797541 RepID=UPI0025ECB36B|nr:hypothetical protein [uncultured Mucilaginibacter sp.]
MNAICTICAKNYLPHAITLGDSVKKFHPEIDFYILLSDEIEGHTINTNGHILVEAKDINVPDYYQLAYKYDVIEFSTSVKPYFLDYLFINKQYDKILYLDPDMVVYNSLNYLFEKLDNYTALLTPHIIKPYIKNMGVTTEEEALFVGIYNLGFFGVKNNSVGRHIVAWWKEKLYDQCFGDKEDALHVDQRWMDYLPALYRENVLILDHPGVNHAFWNFHEREFIDKEAEYSVDGKELVIFHFSGFDANNYRGMCKKQDWYTLDNMPQYERLFTEYLEQLKKNSLNTLSVLRYKYNQYDNDVFILKYQRRLFRALDCDTKLLYPNPFLTGTGSYYELLSKKGLMIYDKKGELMVLKKKFTNPDGMVNKMLLALTIFKKIVGIKRYYLLMRFMAIYSRFEKQTFLLK